VSCAIPAHVATPLDTYQAALATFGTSPTPQNASAVVAARLACMTTVAGDRSSMTLPELPAYIQRLAAAYRPGDVRVVTRDGRQLIVVRHYLLVEVLPKDARAEGTSVRLLAQRWVRAVQRVLPQVAPAPNRFGI